MTDLCFFRCFFFVFLSTISLYFIEKILGLVYATLRSLTPPYAAYAVRVLPYAALRMGSFLLIKSAVFGVIDRSLGHRIFMF